MIPIYTYSKYKKDGTPTKKAKIIGVNNGNIPTTKHRVIIEHKKHTIYI